ncbi:hypothetical protein OIO90_001724 [Microbotryomycetes sp. JL221]|nr:hypothetical protein OIO90_001724 [Microbotryomycetes sp. JL221]
MFDSARALKPASSQFEAFEKQVDNMVVFLRAHRIHKQLVERYNPTHGMTDDERARKSANLVGLQFPDEDRRPKMAATQQQDVSADDNNGKPTGTLQTLRVRTPFHGDD